MMEDAIHDAKQELKRADHLLYVSLKYTRTVDVIKSIIDRLISSFECVMTGLLEKAKKDKKISEIPSAPKLRIETLQKIYDGDEMTDYVEYYVLLRKLSKADYKARQEFRRHVTMEAIMEGKEIFEVNIDICHEYYEKSKKFLEYVSELTGV